MQLTDKELEDIYNYVRMGVLETPLIYSPGLSKLNQGKVFLKLENLQLTNSFKARGAFYKLSRLSDDEKSRGVLAASAGNHGKAVAYFARQLGIKATIVMPVNTPKVKIDACLSYGAEVHFYGDHLAESFKFGNEFANKNNLKIIHPYDDEDIICGQSTAGTEIFKQMKSPIDSVIVPVGGGGLSSGISLAMQAYSPQTKIVGVQSVYAPETAKLLGYTTSLPKPDHTIAEGIGVKAPGLITREILKKYLTKMYIVEEQKIAESIIYGMLKEKVVLEGAGAAGLAVFLNHANDFDGQAIVIVLCGGNIDVSLILKLLS